MTTPSFNSTLSIDSKTSKIAIYNTNPRKIVNQTETCLPPKPIESDLKPLMSVIESDTALGFILKDNSVQTIVTDLLKNDFNALAKTYCIIDKCLTENYTCTKNTTRILGGHVFGHSNEDRESFAKDYTYESTSVLKNDTSTENNISSSISSSFMQNISPEYDVTSNFTQIIESSRLMEGIYNTTMPSYLSSPAPTPSSINTSTINSITFLGKTLSIATVHNGTVDIKNAGAFLKNGNIVTTWVDIKGNIYAKIIKIDGTVVKEAFAVNTDTNALTVKAKYDLKNPAVAALLGTKGGFVITWESNGQDKSGSGIYAQIFDAAGNKLCKTSSKILKSAASCESGNKATNAVDLLVNTDTLNHQKAPVVTGLSNGDFAIAWENSIGTAASHSIYGQKWWQAL